MPTEENWKPNIRFRPADLTRIVALASREQMNTSTWIREASLMRAQLVLEGGNDIVLVPLVYDTAHGIGKSISIRYSQGEYQRIQRAAAKERMLPSVWVRAVVVQRVQEEKERNGEGDQRGGRSAQRERVKNRSTPQVPVVDKPKRQAAARS